MADAEDPKSMTCSLHLFTVSRDMKKELMVLSRKARKCFAEEVTFDRDHTRRGGVYWVKDHRYLPGERSILAKAHEWENAPHA